MEAESSYKTSLNDTIYHNSWIFTTLLVSCIVKPVRNRLWWPADRLQSSVTQILFYSVWTTHSFFTGKTTGSKRTATMKS